MAQLQPVRGTHDLLPEEFHYHRRIGDDAAELAARYGFHEMAPPVFEFTDVFARTLGETSDVVTKEMYTFEDRGGDSITLRPEFTAGVARAFISNGLAQDIPVKVFTRGPVFRHERPQKGRLRQFHQLDVEIIGVAGPQADIEVISLGHHILAHLGLADDVTLEINTLADPESRASYRETLLRYLEGHREKLSDDSKDRLGRNPLRIFDSKDEGDRAIMAAAPLLQDHLNDHSRDFFREVLDGLEALGIPYVENPRLVRGLDYYTHTAFEFTTTKLGAQGAVLAGGRYDGLMEQMGAKPMPGIGWAAGIERLAMMMMTDGAATAGRRPIALVPIGDAASAEAMKLVQRLRHAGFAADLGYSGNVGRRMKRADKIGAAAAVILGEDELAKGVATVRDLSTGEQTAVPLDRLEDHLAAYR